MAVISDDTDICLEIGQRKRCFGIIQPIAVFFCDLFSTTGVGQLVDKYLLTLGR